MKQNKINASKFFATNWTYTPIHWSGHNFDVTGKDEWLFFQYTQDSVSPKNMQNDGEYDEDIVLNIILYSRTEIRTAELYDNVLNMLFNNAIYNMRVMSIDTDNSGIIKTDNGDYTFIDLTIVLKI